MSDVNLKLYTTGRLAGKYCIYFNSPKAKDIFDSLHLALEGPKYVMAGKMEDVEKVKLFLQNKDLTFTETII